MGQEGGHTGSFVYYIGEDRFRSEMMPRMNIPFFVWYIAFSGALGEYQKQVIEQVQALEKNEEPVQSSSFFGLF